MLVCFIDLAQSTIDAQIASGDLTGAAHGIQATPALTYESYD